MSVPSKPDPGKKDSNTRLAVPGQASNFSRPFRGVDTAVASDAAGPSKTNKGKLPAASDFYGQGPQGSTVSRFSENTSVGEEIAKSEKANVSGRLIDAPLREVVIDNHQAKLERSGPDFGGWHVTKLEPTSGDSKAKRVVDNIVGKIRGSGAEEAAYTQPLLDSSQQRKPRTKKSLTNLIGRKKKEEQEPVPGSSKLPPKPKKK
ncbi:hypothetical protein MMC27_002487 [Xylographa pallens]|nr:hypothetical protein [Xylographa pallens]